MLCVRTSMTLTDGRAPKPFRAPRKLIVSSLRRADSRARYGIERLRPAQTMRRIFDLPVESILRFLFQRIR